MANFTPFTKIGFLKTAGTVKEFEIKKHGDPSIIIDYISIGIRNKSFASPEPQQYRVPDIVINLNKPGGSQNDFEFQNPTLFNQKISFVVEKDFGITLRFLKTSNPFEFVISVHGNSYN